MQEDGAAPVQEEEDSKAAKEDAAATGEPDKMDEVRYFG